MALPYFGVTAPASAFALPFGQAISRTTYANLFNLVATTYGAGDGSTTFNLPDLRGYLLAGKDDMGGAAASRITAGASGIAGNTLGAVGGAETVTLTPVQMPVHAHGVNDPTHAHGVSDPTHAHGYIDPTHTHGVSDPTHTHSSNANTANSSYVVAPGGVPAPAPQLATIDAAATGISINAAAIGIAISAAATGIAINAAGTGISIQAVGGGGAHQNMPPTRICNFIMRIL